MPQSLSKVYLHITFSTKQRKKLIDKDIQTKLFEYLGGICKGLVCNPVRVGGTIDHVHILCTLSRKISQAELIEALKKNSSKWMKTQGQRYQNFYWQNGYGAFSVNPTEVDVVTNYINSQEEHHRTKTFQEEFQAFLKKYQVEYDERYVWD
ncbi:IS200/IS605 family transposase [Sunxiuqinia elliptica]|uniref:REP element-mobilizing transposase RayT n=1 Tax=Sunxiuqinia elliptica TaxID=655355 RepID=A0A4V3BXS8_9BACT|nr:IS200/IS605 family transposase [Sunxiuqinia elliptica]TDN99898.1 REP element-mobilizing transposase RayT [Sunxiuqinia elliptica]TDO57090.1 REP element-mobilizing transposase RayT [Sunxiuqinia elliptica]